MKKLADGVPCGGLYSFVSDMASGLVEVPQGYRTMNVGMFTECSTV
jgi:hypothetical protein